MVAKINPIVVDARGHNARKHLPWKKFLASGLRVRLLLRYEKEV